MRDELLEGVEGDIGQTDAGDPEQVRYFADLERRRANREHELWRWVLTQKMGREFLHEVVFGTLGYLRHIPTGGVERLYGEVALHNLACRWMGQFVLRHRDLYLQMVTEASKREDDERRELETRRATWTARGERSDE